MKRDDLTLDVSDLPGYAFGHRSLMWWGTIGMIVIEGSMFAMLIGTYFYLRGRVTEWPPNAPPPDLLYGVINTIILVVSLAPNVWYERAARRLEIKKVRIGLLASIAFAVAFIVVRVYEFGSLNVHWTSNAYGSVVWVLLGFHTVHLVTDFIDTVVITILMFTDKVAGKRFGDVCENAVYWYFVVISWVVIFAVIYLVPRWL